LARSCSIPDSVCASAAAVASRAALPQANARQCSSVGGHSTAKRPCHTLLARTTPPPPPPSPHRRLMSQVCIATHSPSKLPHVAAASCCARSSTFACCVPSNDSSCAFFSCSGAVLALTLSSVAVCWLSASSSATVALFRFSLMFASSCEQSASSSCHRQTTARLHTAIHPSTQRTAQHP
jgi:hypothetical protein